MLCGTVGKCFFFLGVKSYMVKNIDLTKSSEAIKLCIPIFQAAGKVPVFSQL